MQHDRNTQDEIVFYFWEPSVCRAGGHCGLKITYNNEEHYIGWWCKFKLSQDRAVAGIFCNNVEHDSILAGLRMMTLQVCLDHEFLQPPGFDIFDSLYKAIQTLPNQQIDVSSQVPEAICQYFLNQLASDLGIGELKNKEMLKSQLNCDKNTLSERSRDNLAIYIICDELAKYCESGDDMLVNAQQRGKYNKSIELSLENFDVKEIYDGIQELKNLKKYGRLKWAAQVGSQTDVILNNGGLGWLPCLFWMPGAGNLPGIKDYKASIIRHNCASLVLYLLQQGGLERFTQGFDKAKYVRASLEKMISLYTQQDKSLTDADIESRKKKAKMAEHVSSFFQLATCPRNPFPITNQFGTIPYVVYRIVNHAASQSMST